MRRESEGGHGGRGAARSRVHSSKMYAVEDVIAVKYIYRRFVWLVKWKGYPISTWIPTRNFAPKSYWRAKMEELKNTLSKGGSTRSSSFESSPSAVSEGCAGGLNVKDVLAFKEKADGRQYCEVELEGVAGPVWMDIQDLSTCEPAIMRKVANLKNTYDSRHHKDDSLAAVRSVLISDSESTQDEWPSRRYSSEPVDILGFRKRNGVEEWLVKWGNADESWELRQYVERYGPKFNRKMDKLKYEQGTYTVEDVLDFKVSGTGEECFKVKWMGYGTSTWEPRRNLRSVRDPKLLDKMQRLVARRAKLGSAGRARKSSTPRKSTRTGNPNARGVKLRRRHPRLRRDSHHLQTSA